MTYTEKLESDILKLRMQLTEVSNWIEQEYNPEFSSENNVINISPRELFDKCKEVVSSTNNLVIGNQLELFEPSNELPNIQEYEVYETLNSLGKRLLSNASCIKSINQYSLLFNVRACGVIIGELLTELSTKRISREKNESNSVEVPAKDKCHFS